MQRLSSFYVSILLWASLFSSVCSVCFDWNYIVSQTNGTVLEASHDRTVFLNYRTEANTQAWIFLCATDGPGIFYIQNVFTLEVMDVDPVDGQNVILNILSTASRSQQWYVGHDGRIVNAYYRQTLDIQTGTTGSGIIIATVDSNRTQQIFQLQKKI